jgi:DNA-binding Xre family transcriptional regulator
MPKPTSKVRFRLDQILDSQEPAIPQLRVVEKSGLTQVTVNAIARNRTARVDLLTLDRLCTALTKLLGRKVEPGELLERG